MISSVPEPLDAASVARSLAEDWALHDAELAPHHGGMNSRTWFVSLGSSRWILKAVPSADGARLASGLSVAAHVDAAGTPAGSPRMTPDGRWTVNRDGWTLALLRFVDGVGLTGRDESELRLIGATLARVHVALAGIELAGVEQFHWLDPNADHLEIRAWVRPSIVAALAAWERLVPDSLTWGLLHGDPAPEAFLFDRSTGVCGLIDWDRGLHGPRMYDLASAVMYVGGPDRGRPLIDEYVGRRGLDRAEVDRTLVSMIRMRWAVQADYFARRIATRDMTGIRDESENEEGLEDARRAIGS